MPANPLHTSSNSLGPHPSQLACRAGEESLSEHTRMAAAQVQRLNNQKHVHYINTFADSDRSMGKQGLHRGLRTEDVTSDRTGGSRRALSQSGGANGGRGRSSSSFVLGGELVISLMALSALKGSIAHLTSGL